jgi:hypothetical protein
MILCTDINDTACDTFSEACESALWGDYAGERRYWAVQMGACIIDSIAGVPYAGGTCYQIIVRKCGDASLYNWLELEREIALYELHDNYADAKARYMELLSSMIAETTF